MDISRTGNTVQLAAPQVDDNSAAQQQQAAENRRITKAVQDLNANRVFGSDRELTYVIDRHTRKLITRVIDRKTNEVLDQWPPEYVLRMAEYFAAHSVTFSQEPHG